MADLFSLITEFVGFGSKIKSALETAGDNAKGCRRIDDLLGRLRAIAKHLQESPNIMEDDSMRDTVEGLRQALLRASEFVAKYKGKWSVSHAFNAGGIAEKLRGVCLDVLLNMSAVLLANGALNNSVLAELKENVDQLRADVTYTNSMLDKILLIVSAQPDVHLRKEVAKLVEDYQISSQSKNERETKKTGVASSQTKNERETKKTGVASSQNKNKRGAKKADVARQEDKIQKNNKLRETKKIGVASSQTKNERETKKTGVASSQNKNKREATKRDVARQEDKIQKNNKLRETKKIGVASSQTKNERETKKTGVASSQNKNKREATKRDVARQEVKIQKNNKLRSSTVVPHASLPDGESASAASVVGQYDDSSTITNKASSSSSKLVDEAQSVGVSAAPFHPQKIIRISEEPGETGRYKIYTHSSETSKLLEVYPQQLLFPLEPKNKETTQCPVTLINKTEHNVGIWIKPINGRFTKTEKMVMEPHSTLVVFATMNMHAVKFEVLMIIVPEGDHTKLESSIVDKLNVDSGFMVRVEKLKAEVYWAMLSDITCDPASCQIISRSIENKTLVTSIDAHPTKTWIVMGHEGGGFSIWDYQKQKTVMKLQVNEVPDKFTRWTHALSQYWEETPLKHPVFSAKFIAEGKRLVVGDGHGYIYVYDCTGTKLREVNKFEAHDKSVNSLSAHPTEPYLLSSSAFSTNIKVWDSSKDKDWKKIQTFHEKPKKAYGAGVRSVKFNPRDTDTFAYVTFDDRVKVWNRKASSPETTLKGPCVKADYIFTRSQQHLMVTLRFNAHNSEIWDLKTGKVVHTLSVSGRKMTQVACHPKLPILVTTLDGGTVCLWDASTYRLEKMVHITDSECRDLVFLPDTNGLHRLAVAFEKMIAIMEVDLPIASTSNASG